MRSSLRTVIHFIFFLPALNSFAQLNFFRPEIVGQTPDPLITTVNQPITIELENLIVQDRDPLPVYPDGFTIDLRSGKNYSVDDVTVTPELNFTGRLKVEVRVNDGIHDSKKFNLEIEVTGSNNVIPAITGQEDLKINMGQSFEIELSHLYVTDPDNNYPDDFTLNVFKGKDYTLDGNTITPHANFTGNLKVPVSVSDGENESKRFDLKIEVLKAQNVAPIITGQENLQVDQGKTITLKLSDLKVTDPDNDFPQDFALTVNAGENYNVSRNIVTPASNFTGTLTVKVTVNDGVAESEPYGLKIDVIPTVENIPPVITGQKSISLVQNSSLLILLSHLIVNDPDNKYPIGFSLTVLPGDNYTVQGNTITPLPNFTGSTLSVTVTVNDGMAESAAFELQIQIVPASSTPIINGQKELSMPEDSSMTIHLSYLEITDTDNPNAKGFSLKVLPGNNDVYTVAGNTITPALNLNGFIEVGVTVSDGINISPEFKLAILVTPVNDRPEILNFEKTPLPYEPGGEPIFISETFDVVDVDNDHLSMAEIGFRPTYFSPTNDELIFTADSTNIKAIYDPEGILYLVGYATLEEYKTAIRSIKYNYRITRDENGNPAEILSGTRTLYVNLHDGQMMSDTHERQITMETKVSLEIPNTFTPNGDNSNDTWRIQAPNKDQLGEAVIRVYNRRGLLLYESIGFEQEWDGISNGEVLPVDTYYYTIDLNLSYVKQTYKGAVTILH